MLNKLSGKYNNNYMLVAGFIVVALIVYYFSISKTLELRHNCNEMIQQADSAKDAPREISNLKDKLLQIDELINKNNEVSSGSHAYLLSFLSTYCEENDIIIKDFPKSHILITSQYAIETNRITFEGEFMDLINLLYRLETMHLSGHINSATFTTIPIHKNGFYKLNMTIYEQNIQHNNIQ